MENKLRVGNPLALLGILVVLVLIIIRLQDQHLSLLDALGEIRVDVINPELSQIQSDISSIQSDVSDIAIEIRY